MLTRDLFAIANLVEITFHDQNLIAGLFVTFAGTLSFPEHGVLQDTLIACGTKK